MTDAQAKLEELTKFCYENDLSFKYSAKMNCIKIKDECPNVSEPYNQWHSLDPYYRDITAAYIAKTISHYLKEKRVNDTVRDLAED